MTYKAECVIRESRHSSTDLGPVPPDIHAMMHLEQNQLKATLRVTRRFL